MVEGAKHFRLKWWVPNVVDFTIAQPMGSYGDRIYSVTYQHEVFVNEDEWRAALGAIVARGLRYKAVKSVKLLNLTLMR